MYRNVLFIDYFIPPLSANWRGISLLKLLPRHGWNPIVLTAAETVRYEKDYSLMQTVPPGSVIHRIHHEESSGLIAKLARRAKLSFDFPDSFKNWIRPSILAARKVIAQNRIDLLYSASPTFSTAFVAMALHTTTGIPWVADFLDGWSVNEFLMRQIESTIRQPIRSYYWNKILRAEKTILSTADAITVIHPVVKRQWEGFHKISEGKIHVVTDGYDESLFEKLTPLQLYPGKINIVFLGSYYPQFEHDIRSFCNTVYDVDPTVEMIFIGRGSDWIQKMQLQNVTCILNVPRMKALAFALGCTFLFVTMPRYALWTPTKTYDYLRLRKPILALVPKDGDTAKILLASGSGFVLDYEKEAMREQVRLAFAASRNETINWFHPDEHYIAQFDRERVAEKMVTVFNHAATPR